ncbi:ferrous iron transport protein A [Myxococcota bacterium]|nr:ferrous iron transport protein A [Myxococcota bacterium]
MAELAQSDEIPLASLSSGTTALLTRVGGDRAFRRRVMELGLVPGSAVQKRQTAPLGDPIELEVRGCRLSIRRAEAEVVWVKA